MSRTVNCCGRTCNVGRADLDLQKQGLPLKTEEDIDRRWRQASHVHPLRIWQRAGTSRCAMMRLVAAHNVSEVPFPPS